MIRRIPFCPNVAEHVSSSSASCLPQDQRKRALGERMFMRGATNGVSSSEKDFVSSGVSNNSTRAVRERGATSHCPSRRSTRESFKFLDSLIPRVSHLEMALAVHGHAVRSGELPRPAAAAADAEQKLAFRRERLDAIR